MNPTRTRVDARTGCTGGHIADDQVLNLGGFQLSQGVDDQIGVSDMPRITQADVIWKVQSHQTYPPS
jgi:hypothetical protein